MDPRKAATVTAPDLTKAFEEGHGLPKSSTHPEQDWKLYLVLFAGGEAVEKHELDSLEDALQLIGAHLGTVGNAVAMTKQAAPPEGWDRILSASDDETRPTLDPDSTSPIRRHQR